MSKKIKCFMCIITTISLTMGFMRNVSAMHIMEGFLPLGFCVSWGVVCIPFLIMSLHSIDKIVKEHRKTLLVLAMVGAYSFVLSALKIPSVTGSSSHATGTGLGAILFGPSVMPVIGLIVLLFQALLLAHGGITTLGANTFSMAIAGPFVSFGIYKICSSIKLNKKISIFLAAAIGDLATYIVTSFQLALAHQAGSGGFLESFYEFIGIFAFTQVPLAIVEGILTVVIIIGLETYAKSELKELEF